jgi:hypothetical protein
MRNWFLSSQVSNAAWPFRQEHSSDHAVPTAVTYSVRELSKTQSLRQLKYPVSNSDITDHRISEVRAIMHSAQSDVQLKQDQTFSRRKIKNYVTMLLYEIWQKFTCVSRKGAAAIYRVPPIRGLIYTGPWDPPSIL